MNHKYYNNEYEKDSIDNIRNIIVQKYERHYATNNNNAIGGKSYNIKASLAKQ